ncbi:MAG: DUF1292 domain-containing protein [Ruminococcus sp.]|nr:DUF1292 domain-containing protein [Ruminococcus sp.]
MSELNEKDVEEFDEDNENYITLTDDDGKDISFEILDTIEYKERIFAVLLPFEDTDDEVVILEVIPAEDPEYDDFVSVDDEELLNEVFEEFKKKNEGEFDFD